MKINYRKFLTAEKYEEAAESIWGKYQKVTQQKRKQKGYTEVKLKENSDVFQLEHKDFSQFFMRMLIIYLRLVVATTWE